ncbi:MAG: hypothetical protein KDB80_06270 [Planctomycetes bacterium]|nr:hypothetical protein [Planctomycetota bacterium]
MKLPINQLLYVAIAGLLGGSAWQFYETWKEIRKEDARAEQRQREASDTCKLRLEKGRSLNVVSKGPNYAENQPWDHFKDANLIGKLPPPPPKPIDPEEQKKPEKPPETPLEDICAIVCLVFQEDQSMAILRYQETSNVEPPEEILEAFSPPDTVTPTPRTNNKNRRNAGKVKTARPIARAMPTTRVGGFVQTLRLEDNLWPPYDHIKLVAIDGYAEFAEFSRTAEDGSESAPERLYRDELGLSQAVMERLHEEGYTRGSKPRSVNPETSPEEIPEGLFGIWAGGDDTKRINGDFHIGRREWKDWNEDSNRIFNRELQTKSYSGRNGVSGVQITKVSERFQQFGVQAGDVIVSVNGEPVRSKAQAITVGKRLYKRGVRTFNVVFLSRGAEVTRTYVAPDQGR